MEFKLFLTMDCILCWKKALAMGRICLYQPKSPTQVFSWTINKVLYLEARQSEHRSWRPEQGRKPPKQEHDPFLWGVKAQTALALGSPTIWLRWGMPTVRNPGLNQDQSLCHSQAKNTLSPEESPGLPRPNVPWVAVKNRAVKVKCSIELL